MLHSNRKLRVLCLIPTFSPREGGVQLFVYSIADNLADCLETRVLTRRYADTPGHELRGTVEIDRYWHPLPERWKSYATGAESVRSYEKYLVAGFDSALAVPYAVRLAGKVDSLVKSLCRPN